MFKMSTVTSCPVAKGCQGRIEIDPEILGWFAGAAEDNLEWLALLLGTATKDGFEVRVENLFVPHEQTRTSGSCDLEDKDIPDHIRPLIVGIVHSHHSMGAFFSGTDRGEDGVNPRFPCSIVISSKGKRPEEFNLGFGYEAEGRVVLDCGSIGVVKFGVVPSETPDWPHKVEVKRPSHLSFPKKEVATIGDCDNYSLSAESNRYQSQKTAGCSLRDKETILTPSVFGRDGKPILSLLPKPNYGKGWQGGKIWTPSSGWQGGGRSDDKRNWWDDEDTRRGISRESYSRYDYARVVDPREETTKVDDDQTIDEYSKYYLTGWGHDPRE